MIFATSGRVFHGTGKAAVTAQTHHIPAAADISEAQRRSTSVDYRRLDARLQRLVEQQKMVGMAVGIVEDGEIRFLKGYGVTTEGGEAVTPDTVFRWASLSKGVAADMVTKLAAQGKLALHDPVGRYAASLHLPQGYENRATVTDLLSHRLGLFAHAYEPNLESGDDPHVLRGRMATLNAICAPGQCHAYQNVAYDAASEIVEKVTGIPYQQVVEEQLFRPLGMRTASLTRNGLESSRSWAPPHVGGKNSKPPVVTDSYYRVPAAGGVNGSIKDLAIWMRAQMGENPDVLPPPVLHAVQTALVQTPQELGRMRNFRERLKHADYGLGWRVYDYDGHRIIAHRGGVTGYRSLIMFDPQLKSGVVALWNSSTNQPGGLEFEVMDMLYKLPPRDWLALEKMGQTEPDDATPA